MTSQNSNNSEAILMPANKDGSVNPEWLRQHNENDPLTSEIMAFFLSGELLKPEIKCHAAICVMPTRSSYSVNSSTSSKEFDPMLFCFYCDRTFHVGCYDLNGSLLQEETVPWSCRTCRSDILNTSAKNYFDKTAYKLTMLERRRSFLVDSAAKENADSFAEGMPFNVDDCNSFTRRATRVVKEDFPDAKEDEITTLIKFAMKARADRNRAKLISQRFQRELEAAQKTINSLQVNAVNQLHPISNVKSIGTIPKVLSNPIQRPSLAEENGDKTNKSLERSTHQVSTESKLRWPSLAGANGSRANNKSLERSTHQVSIDSDQQWHSLAGANGSRATNKSFEWTTQEVSTDSNTQWHSLAQMNGTRANDHSLSFATAQHSSMYPSGNLSLNQTNKNVRPEEVLTSFYTAEDRTAGMERNSFIYRPPNVQRPPVINEQSRNGSNESRGFEADLTTLVSRLTHAQERGEERHLLESRRKAAPKLTEFDGDDSKWLMFKQDIERYRYNCQFDDETIKFKMRAALKGEALALVRDIFDTSSLDIIMSTLKYAYGDEMKVVRNRSEDLKRFKFDSVLYKTDAIKLQAIIQAYFSACNYAETGYLNTNVLGECIFNQFNPEDRQRCKEFYRNRNPDRNTIVLNVQTIYDYILYRMPLLDDMPPKKVTNHDKG